MSGPEIIRYWFSKTNMMAGYDSGKSDNILPIAEEHIPAALNCIRILMHGAYPNAVLMIEMSPDDFDSLHVIPEVHGMKYGEVGEVSNRIRKALQISASMIHDMGLVAN